MLSCYFFYPLHLYVFVLICQYYVVLLERTNKDIIYNEIWMSAGDPLLWVVIGAPNKGPNNGLDQTLGDHMK